MIFKRGVGNDIPLVVVPDGLENVVIDILVLVALVLAETKRDGVLELRVLFALCDSCRRLAAQQTMNSLRTPREDEIPSMQGEGRVRARIGRGGYKGSRLY